MGFAHDLPRRSNGKKKMAYTEVRGSSGNPDAPRSLERPGVVLPEMRMDCPRRMLVEMNMRWLDICAFSKRLAIALSGRSLKVGSYVAGLGF